MTKDEIAAILREARIDALYYKLKFSQFCTI